MLCRDTNCKNEQHGRDVCITYDLIVHILNDSSKSFYKCNKKVHTIKPGWKEHVTELHTAARYAYKMWAESGGPMQGTLFEHKQATNEWISQYC